MACHQEQQRPLLVHNRSTLGAPLPNPSLESGPSEAGRLGPGRASHIIVAARAKAPCLSGPAQLER